MFYPVLILLCVLGMISLVAKPARETKTERTLVNCTLIILACILSIMACFRPLDMPDSKNYILIFNDTYETPVEIGFKTLASIIRASFNGDYILFFFISALFSISLKLIAIRKLSQFLWCSLVIYISSKFILHDMIQMRCAIASGFFLWSIYYIVNRNLIKYSILTICAILFHWTALIMIPIWFLNTNTIKSKYWIIAIVGSYVLATLQISAVTLFEYVPIGEIQDLYLRYMSHVDHESNLFSFIVICKALLCICFLFASKRLIKATPYYVIMVKLFAVSICSYVLLIALPVAAARISEFLQIVELILIPYVIYLFPKNRMLGKVINAVIAAIYFWFYSVVQQNLI